MNNKLGIAMLVAVVIITGSYILFNKLGGDNPVEISLIKKNPESLTGIYYIGTPQDEKLKKAFEEVETQKSLHPGTYLHTIYEVEPAGKLDTMRVFIGLNQALSGENFESRIFQEKQYLLAKIQSSSWVMPGPEKVKEQLLSFADSAKLTLSGVFIDKIITDNEVHVIAPVKD
ncbi:hypothetical protein [Algoriphagus sp. PAP.12]|uniref:hypothetical protein n=1 Tax=Algoriphagus sp. PAP.12 TaxID=2996678 RepID=UPI00227BAD18|nr:hypothetical protein [Algoriphagus sp. PAP.12]